MFHSAGRAGAPTSRRGPGGRNQGELRGVGQEVTDVRAALLQVLEHRDAGRLAEAAELCARVVAAAPRHEGARLLLGVLALQSGRWQDAEAPLRETIALAPHLPAAHQNLGLALRRQGRTREALASYDRALELSPGAPEILNSRGVALLDLGRLDEALASFDSALAREPSLAPAHGNRGLALMGLQRPAEALASFEAAIAVAPSDAAFLQGKGDALSGLGRLDQALAAYDAAIAASPEHVEAVANRATTLNKLGRLHDALAGWEAAIALRPENPGFAFERANILSRIGRLNEAVDGFTQVVQARPDVREAIYHRGLARLALGAFREGWADYEARWEAPEFLRTSANAIPPELRARFSPTLDVAALAGRRVLAVAEQGVGDVIMFASMLPDLAAVAGAVTFCCERRFQRLMRHAFPNVVVRDREAWTPDPEDYGHVVPIGSLGRLFRNDLAAFPGAPYLSASPDLAARWAQRLEPRDGVLRVGLSWRGGLKRTGRDERSLPLAALRPVLDLPGCTFVSLQYGDAASEIEAWNAGGGPVIRHVPPDEIDDFEDLAALVQSLDLVVSVQTAVVHLAGAVGAPCLVMTPAQAGWRYPAAAARPPWYETVKVFRQTSPGDWARVIDRVADEVRAAARSHWRDSD